LTSFLSSSERSLLSMSGTTSRESLVISISYKDRVGAG
jgi:hypothetical protein